MQHWACPMAGRQAPDAEGTTVLTMHQPWASLLVYGIKRIEGNRAGAPYDVAASITRRKRASSNDQPVPVSAALRFHPSWGLFSLVWTHAFLTSGVRRCAKHRSHLGLPPPWSAVDPRGRQGGAAVKAG